MARPTFNIAGLEGITRKLKLLARAGEDAVLFNQIGAYIKLAIKARTLGGKDVDGKTFKAYSPGYLRARRKAGLGTSTVDLFFTGSMQSAMTHDAEKDKVEVFFMPTSDKFGGKNPEKAFFLHQDRPFFALSSEDLAEIEDLAEDYLKSLVRR